MTASAQSVWNGSVDDSWNQPLNWTAPGVPNGSGAVVNIVSPLNNPVLLNGSITVGSLLLGPTNSLQIQDGSNLREDLGIVGTGSFTNTGSILLNGAGDQTYLYVGNGGSQGINLTGGGTVTLSNSAHNGATFITGDGNATLTNVDNTIVGEGQIGWSGGMALVNDTHGVIDANSNHQALVLNSNSGVTNQGTLEATAGGILQLDETTADSGGLITTDTGNNSKVQLFNGANIQGGTLSGNVQTASGNYNPVLDGSSGNGALTNSGTFTVVDGSQVTTLGSIINSGSIVLQGTGDATQLYVGNGTTAGTVFSGGGTIQLINTAHNGATLLYGDGSATLENVNNLIEGEGQIGASHGMALLNDANGVIDANSGGQALVLNAGSGVTNHGLLEATSGGILQLDETTFNQGGTIGTDTGNGSVVQLFNGSDIVGGTLQGNIQIKVGNSNPLLDGATDGALTNAGTLTVVDGSQVNTTGTINNTGSILLNGTGDATQLNVGNGSSAGTLFTGGGQIQLSNSAHNGTAVLYGDGSATLENFNNLIEGEGQIGAGHGMVLLNDANGVIDANSGGQVLLLDAGSGVTNHGLLEATSGGILQLDETTVNQGATISTDTGNGSVVQLLNGSDIVGGTLQGNIQTKAGQFNPVLDGATDGALTNAGTLTVVDGSEINTHGTINNTGSIVLKGNGDNTYLYVGNGVGTTFTGGGTIQLVNPSHNGDTGIFGDGNAAIENVDNTIEGEGNIGFNHGLALQNDANGLVDANSSGQALTLDAGSGVTNMGRLEATNGGILQLTRTINNVGGIISTDAGNGSYVQLFNSTVIQGGTLEGDVRTVSGNFNPVLDGSTNAVTNAGTFTVVDNSEINTTGTIKNTGSIVLNGSGDNTYLYVGNGGGTTFTGGGTIQLINSSHNGGTGIFGDGSATIENYDNTIEGEGNIGFSHGVSLVNDAGGTVLANVSGQSLTLDTTSVSNAGTFHVTSGATMNISATLQQSSGLTQVDSGGTLNANNINISGGTLKVNGTVDPASIDIFHGATLEGSGLIIGDDVVSDGTTILGDTPTDSGTLTVDADFTQNADGTLVDGLDSETHDGLLDVTGSVSLNGTIDVDLDGIQIQHGDVFALIEGYSSESIGAITIDPNSGLSSDWSLALNDLGSDQIDLVYEGPSYVPPQQGVPEPSAWLDIAFLAAVAVGAPILRRQGLRVRY